MHVRILSIGSEGVSPSCISICKRGDIFKLGETGLAKEAGTGSLRHHLEKSLGSFSPDLLNKSKTGETARVSLSLGLTVCLQECGFETRAHP